MTVAAPLHHAVLLVSCADSPGIVHAISTVLMDNECSITQSQQFGDPLTGSFFMRVEFATVSGDKVDFETMRAQIGAVAELFDMTWKLADPSVKQRVVLMVSKFAHCLNALLFRNSIGDLNVEIVAVVSNHPDLGFLADNYKVPFRHIPVTKDTKDDAERQLMEFVDDNDVDLVVLARYMQILSDDLCRKLEGRAINIHHSMLPSFKGARPYHQAHARGVKLIGATAHYVTADLDEGPIIEQDLLRVDHSLSPDEFAARGREVEIRALARAVRWHTENRLALNGTSCVVFQ